MENPDYANFLTPIHNFPPRAQEFRCVSKVCFKYEAYALSHHPLTFEEDFPLCSSKSNAIVEGMKALKHIYFPSQIENTFVMLYNLSFIGKTKSPRMMQYCSLHTTLSAFEIGRSQLNR